MESGKSEQELENGTSRAAANGTHSERELSQNPSGAKAFLQKFVWHGGSVYDAWLNAVSAQVGQVILTMPTSYAQMGYKWGLIFHLMYASIGVYTCYLLARLYVEYRARKEKEGVDFKRHVIQYHELLGGLVGPWAMRISLFFNIVTVGAVATIQIIACASNAYYLNSQVSKRTWAIIFGALSLTVDLLPTLHNFRVFSFVGALTTTYTSWYMLSSALANGQVRGVKHSGPQNIRLFFTGTTNILFGTGGHAVTIEIMHAMWRPVKYKYVYVACTIYVLFITVPHSYTLYWAYGDKLLHENNALGLLPSSNARTTALIFMILHQAIAFGIYIMPLNFMWEKYWGLHQAHYLKRVLIRIPIGILLWFFALMIPFFGPLNSIIGALFMSFSVFIIPCMAYTYTFWKAPARENAAEKPGKVRRILGWPGMMLINFVVITIIATLGVGFGSYASISNIVLQVKSFGLFQACYQC
jgi:auxin influx carrier (AUX1 LAX family)